MQKMNFVGLDVHARKIAIAVDGYGGLKSLGNIPHDLAKLKRVLKKTGRPEDVHVFYEAGPTGYGLCRSLRTMGYHCDVVAPSLIPSMSGDRVKTDRRDAEKLAQLGRANLLTSVWVPGVHQEALRDLVRAREAAMRAQKTAGQQLDKFLLRHGRRPDEKMTKWTAKYLTWVRTQRFVESAQQVVLEELIAEYDHQRERLSRIERHMHVAAEKLPEQSQATVRALVALKGVRFLTAITLVSEIGDMMRFSHPTQLMSYTGVVPAEHSSGDSVRRGPITKAGNAHLRRIVGEASWSYARGISTPSAAIKKRREGLSPAIVLIAERADQRLRSRYRRLAARGKHKNKIATAIARELLGFVWAIGVQAQLEATQSESRAAA